MQRGQRKLTCDGLDVFGCRWRRGKRCWYSVSWRPKGLQGGPCLGRDFRSNRSLGPLRSGILHGGQLGRCGDERYRLTFLHGRRNMRVNKAKKKKKKTRYVIFILNHFFISLNGNNRYIRWPIVYCTIRTDRCIHYSKTILSNLSAIVQLMYMYEISRFDSNVYVCILYLSYHVSC